MTPLIRIEYICNPDKTDKRFIFHLCLAPETAALDLKIYFNHNTEQNFSDGQDKENKAFHLIQAFLPKKFLTKTHAI